MDIGNVLYAALFCFAMVFGLLGCLYALVRLTTRAIRVIESKTTK